MINEVNGGMGEIKEEDVDLVRYIDILLESKWLISGVCFVVLIVGIAFAFLTRPTYKSDILIQVEEDSPTSASSVLAGVSSLFDVKTQAEDEVQILQSRMVVEHAVEDLHLYITATPRYFPIFGWRIAENAKGLSHPGFLGLGGYCWGNEKIEVKYFDVPKELEETRFRLTVIDSNRYRLDNPELDQPIEGKIGKLNIVNQSVGQLRILVSSIYGNPGAVFNLSRQSELKTIADLQDKLVIGQVTKQSNVMSAVLRGHDADKIAKILNAIGRAYVDQNIKRKTAEAEKSSKFLENLLPGLKSNLDRAEKRYNDLRSQRGTFNLGLEAQAYLQESVAAQNNLGDLQQKRAEVATRFANDHPALQALDQQIATIKSKLIDVSDRLKMLPTLEQDTVSLLRDVQVDTDIYVGTLNNIQQLKLVAAGKVGSVREVDYARVSEEPVTPKRPLVIAIAAVIGLLIGVIAAFIRESLYGGITDANEIERFAGLNVYGTIPLSNMQKLLNGSVQSNVDGTFLLADRYPDDPTVESLRSLRTALAFAMLDAKNNLLMLTGPSPGIGKSFLAANLAAVVCGAGKRVVLVDADMRRGYLNALFGKPRGTGLSNVLANQSALSDAILRDVSPGLDLITTGSIPPNPSDLLLVDNMRRTLETLSGLYDIVIIDAPPVLAAPDASILAVTAGTVFLVAHAKKTTIGELVESTRQLQRAQSIPKGVIFNGIEPRALGYRSKYGSYRYVAYKYGSDKSRYSK
ncbi:polysaccharide biosynthesis tyrosine autokinase [Paraburkholderia caribensis]|uniref:Putative tyrosine-protein kinase EpsB n=1 Tax=Paraburkholderia caribensis TaxID=75105 RepID=A0A9Q6S8M9_9BURK|nr:polysaccharide biosynthesis tyrosine autokinase [Paraburkholderia caribensis]MCO4880895.1 polysaccharide biosynthesis tyrosine autokinase [Paraburkholderia caribensis]PTB24620.1 tyrosine protein kinase [Paraburkholderia caribensis]QLB66179.1 tyrosine protein kinase [Paraburkholderia caribensis]